MNLRIRCKIFYVSEYIVEMLFCQQNTAKTVGRVRTVRISPDGWARSERTVVNSVSGDMPPGADSTCTGILYAYHRGGGTLIYCTGALSV